MRTKAKRFLCMMLASLMVLSSPIAVFAENNAGSESALTSGSEETSTGSLKNLETGATYDDIWAAFQEAKEGETIALLGNMETALVSVPEKVTLDLNGYTLEAEYVTCYGNIVDFSESNEGILKVADKKILIQNENEQLPVKTGEGYRFFEVEKYNTLYETAKSRYVFQPFIDADAHELIKEGTSGVTIGVRISWTEDDGSCSQDFVYSEEQVQRFLSSYKPATGKYGQMFALTLKNAEKYDDLEFCAVTVSGTGVTNKSEMSYMNQPAEPTVTPAVTPEGTTGELDKDVTLDIEDASAVVAEGTKLDGKALALTTEEMAETTTDVELAAGEEMLSLNVHVDGIAKDNTVPVLVTINEIAPEYLNKGNITLYHVENGVTVEMTRVYSLEEVDEHNEFYYDILTGTVTMALASFSEIAVRSAGENAWNGEFDYSWYAKGITVDSEKGIKEYTIANADQLAAFGAIVGGMKLPENITQDTFDEDIVRLIADINLGDDEANNDPEKIFYPIGYYNSIGSYEKVSGGSVTSSVSSFEGTFDGNGHTVSNFYQNTWEMFGDYNDGYSGTPNHYKDAMGLFGYVVNGTVKNLTVDNFSSDGEFTPTGVIAAYAVNSTFENIAITNCNPRVYNTGNGGIVGIGGSSDDPDTYKLTFNNITIDNTNKITALWGSWDVACGGLVGMFRGAGHVYMTNCHVAAQMDVYNDVCGNYQYYWYRYSGMMVGTNKNMVTDKDGYTVPETSKFHAENCTVHFGDWNDYYYCELVANSLASYTHDHQFSRLTEVKKVDGKNIIYLDGTKGTVPDAGRCNYVVVNGEEGTENATCYHFVDGKVHNHNDYNGDGVEDYEVVNGESILVENNQHIYLPFNQLFTGYGWGVKHIPVYNGENYAFKGITILERLEAVSVKKFDTVEDVETTYTIGSTVTIGEIFKASEAGLAEKTKIDTANVQVSVSAVGDDSSATGTYIADTTDWRMGTLTFSGIGKAQIIITDYNFCERTVLNVTIENKPIVDKFVAVADKPTVYAGQPITLGELFAGIEGKAIDSELVSVSVNNADVDYVANADDWTKSTLTFKKSECFKITIKEDEYCNEASTEVVVSLIDAFKHTFPNTEKYLYRVGNDNAVSISSLFELVDGVKNDQLGEVNVEVNSNYATYKDGTGSWDSGSVSFSDNYTGVVKVTISSDYAKELVLPLEVVDAKNITSAISSDGVDVVLLNNVKITANGTAHYTDCTVYGNGFEYDVHGGMNQYNSKQGHGIIIISNATLDHLRIVGDVYKKYGMYTTDLLGKPQDDYTAVLDATNSTIQNCYIANCAAPIRSNGNTIIDTTLYGGTIANLLISGGRNVLTNVTTVNYNDGRGVIGMGIVITDGASADSTKLILNGYLKQHNYVYETDVKVIEVDEAKTIFNSMFESQFSEYHIGNDPKAVNTGIISINESIKLDNAMFVDNANTDYKITSEVPVEVSAKIGTTTVKAAVASVPGDGSIVDNDYKNREYPQGDYLPIFTVELGAQMDSNDGVDDTRYLVGDESGIEALYQSNESPITLDLTKLATVTKYGQNLKVSVMYKDSDDAVIGTDTTVELGSSGTLVFTVSDNLLYDANGNKLEKTVERIFEVPLTLSIKEATIKNAEITISKTEINGDYNSSKYMTFNPLEAITIKDYDISGKETTVTLNKNISSKTVEYNDSKQGAWGGATITITYTDGRVLTVYLAATTMNSPGSNSGGKTITVQSDGSIKTDGKVANGSATGGTWNINGYSFKGNNGSTISNNTIVTVKFADESSCVTGDTFVMLADGTQKRIDEVTYTDNLLVWNFFEGEYATVPASIIFYHGDDVYRVVVLNFADGTTVKTINGHGFFDVEENEFVFINEENVEQYIGNHFVKTDGDGYTEVELVSYDIIEEYTGCYSIQSAMYNNFITEGMFSLTVPPYEGWFDYFEIGENMKYNEEKMQADIQKYGVYSYEDFSDYVTYEQFIAFNGPYLKALVGRGVLTYDQIIELIKIYVQ